MGKHVLMDGVGTIPSDVRSLLMHAATAAGATVLHAQQINLPCPKSKPHSPPGGTAVVLLDESHISMHWYDREDGRALIAIDAFTCGEAKPEVAIDYLILALEMTVLQRDTHVRFAMAEV